MKRLGQDRHIQIQAGAPLWEVLGQAVDRMNIVCGQYEWQANIGGIETLYNYDIEDELLAAPLSWLVELNKLHPRLGRFAEKTVALMQRKAEVWFDFDRALEYMDFIVEDHSVDSGWVEEEKYKAIQLARAQYRYGTPADYNKRIAKLDPDPDELLKVIDRFEAQEDWQQKVIDWCREGIRVATTGKLSDFINNEEEIGNYPDGVWPEEYIRFMWNMEDAMFDEIYDGINNTWQEYGTVPITHFILLTETEGEIPEYPPQWPYELKAWMLQTEKLEEAVTIAWREMQCKTLKSRSSRR